MSAGLIQPETQRRLATIAAESRAPAREPALAGPE